MKSRARPICVFLCAASLVASLGADQGRRKSPPSTVGAYQLDFRGALTGRGNATVTPTAVSLQALLRDTTGNTANFVASSLPLKDGRFSGSGTMAGLPVRVVGRVDPPSEIVPVARLSCTVVTAAGEAGRGLGGRQ
jgi:hypothetical protein